MKIEYSDKELKKCSQDERRCIKLLGKENAEKFFTRLGDLDAANTLEDVRYLPGHYHELTQNLKGFWACDLVQPYRLIFHPLQNPIPTDEDGKYKWYEIVGVSIDEIKDYHKEKGKKK